MKYCRIFAIIFLILISFQLMGKTEAEYNYEFTTQDTNYSFCGSFYVQGDPDSILSQIWDFSRINHYSPGIKDIKLIQKGDNWYDVKFIYQYLLVFYNTSVWRRIFFPEQNLITFRLLSNSSNSKLIPDIKTSWGYYKVQKIEGISRIEIYQECSLTSGELNTLYFSKAKKELIRILKQLKKFLEKG